MHPKATIGVMFLLLVSCTQELTEKSSVEMARQRDLPVGADGRELRSNPEREAEFRVFWTGFRQDVLSRDWAGLSTRVEFPLKTRATLDTDPVIEVGKADFQRVFSSFLAGEDPSHFGENEETLIRKLSTPDPAIVDDWVRIGDMQFRRGKAGWKLYWIYFDAAEMMHGGRETR